MKKNSLIKLSIYDKEDKIGVELPSKRKGVNISNGFINELMEIGGVSFDLNKA